MRGCPGRVSGHQGPTDVGQVQPHLLGPEDLDGVGEPGELAGHGFFGVPPDLHVDPAVFPAHLHHAGAEDVAQDVERARVRPEAHAGRSPPVVQRGHDGAPGAGQVEAFGALYRLVRWFHRVHAVDPEGPLAGFGLRDQVPDLVLDDQTERVHHPQRHLPVPSGVVQPDLPALDHRRLQVLQGGRRRPLATIPVGGVEHHRPGRRLGPEPERRRQGLDQFAQGRLDLGGGGRGAGDQEQGLGFGPVRPLRSVRAPPRRFQPPPRPGWE